MSYNMYNIAVPTLQRLLTNLSSILIKAEAHATTHKIDPAVMLNSRLALDMFPLTRQIQIMTDNAKGIMARLSGQDAPVFPDNETTFAELQTRIAKTQAYINTFTESDFDGASTREITMPWMPEFPMSAEFYLMHYAIPNVYFHMVTAYDILRQDGVAIGKIDFLGAVS